MAFNNLKKLSYNILKTFGDDLVKDMGIGIFHVLLRRSQHYHAVIVSFMLCLENEEASTSMPNTCPFPDCGKNVDIIEQASARRDSQSSQSSMTSAISTLMGEKLILTSPKMRWKVLKTQYINKLKVNEAV